MKKVVDLVARVAAMQDKALSRPGRVAKPKATSNVVQLPIWPEPTRGVPNGVLRSALFGAIKNGKNGERRYMDREQVAALDGVEIRYTGQRLDQGDLDVWESVLHVARVQGMGEQCRFTAYSLLKLLGKTDSGKNRDTLHARLTRLRANAVDIKQGRYTYIGGLIDEAYRDEETKEWVVVLNPKLHALFAADQFTQVEWDVRHALDGKHLAQWLHGFYASHAKAFPMKVETLHKLCGSQATVLTDFAKTLRKSLDAVAEASEAHGERFDYEILGDLVHVAMKPSSTQKKHLSKRPSRLRKPRD